jgi:DNA-binding NtrC family response regulator
MGHPAQHDAGLEVGRSLDALFEGVLEQASQQNGGSTPKLRDWLDLAETWRIGHALRACRGNRSAAARALGIGRRTLYAKLDKLAPAPSSAAAPDAVAARGGARSWAPPSLPPRRIPGP